MFHLVFLSVHKTALFVENLMFLRLFVHQTVHSVENFIFLPSNHTDHLVELCHNLVEKCHSYASFTLFSSVLH